MGSKIDARRLVSAAGVPVVPGETPDDQSDRGLRQAVERVGLPALIKASAGGGGKGMRQVREAGEIDASIQAARREAAAAFGDGTLYVERLVERAAARRGADLRRRPRTGRAPLRARLLGAAPSPESHRGKPVARRHAGPARAHHRGRRRRRARRGLPQCRHDRVSRRSEGRVAAPRRGSRRAVLLPRNEHAAAGRAPGHRAGDRRRSRAGAAARRRRSAAAVEPGAISASAATRSKRASTPRIRRRDSCRRRAGCSAIASLAGRASASIPASPKATRCRSTTTR